ncbi:MAG: hypothetical protein R3338_14645, partial [Thermoanaerobaculia bacterium]|nr:hypothetical protein [Thermoanaerobaculia bacterium]
MIETEMPSTTEEKTAEPANPIPESPRISYWEASDPLRDLLARKLTPDELEWARPHLESIGLAASGEVRDLAAIADRETPLLVQWDERGERIDRVDYHPAYRRMEEIAYGSGMIGMKYEPEAGRSNRSLQLTCFAMGYLFAMAEMGLYCPVCMTDGVARILTRFGSGQKVAETISRLTTTDPSRVWTGGMFLTER